MKCRKASHLISLSMEKKLPFIERVGLRFHLLICDACTNFYRQLHLLRKAMGMLAKFWESDPSVKLSDEAKQRISENLKSKHPD